jgi:mono/diheme cytochrome c family protein
MRYAYYVLFFVCVLTVCILGFQGHHFTQPPLEVFPNALFPEMTYQQKYKPQGASDFFADGRADRPLPPGVVSREALRDDDEVYLGKDNKGQFIRHFPKAIAVDSQLLERGRERFTIYCSPCHGALGDGNGITKQYGMGATPSYHDDRIRGLADGEIFNIITNGKNTMLPYGDKVVPQDRWAIVAYVRALQRAQMGTINDVPAANKSELGLK